LNNNALKKVISEKIRYSKQKKIIMNNASNPKFNEKDVENKLKGFKEGADYSVLRENGNKFYNFHNDFLKSMLGTSH